jgi:uncharacterized repeat protein (TIGR03803 family)
VVHTFAVTDGCNPHGGLVQATDGSLYGVTVGGGANGFGTVYSLSVGLGPFVKTLPHMAPVGAPVKILGSNLAGTSSRNVPWGSRRFHRRFTDGGPNYGAGGRDHRQAPGDHTGRHAPQRWPFYRSAVITLFGRPVSHFRAGFAVPRVAPAPRAGWPRRREDCPLRRARMAQDRSRTSPRSYSIPPGTTRNQFGRGGLAACSSASRSSASCFCRAWYSRQNCSQVISAWPARCPLCNTKRYFLFAPR